MTGLIRLLHAASLMPASIATAQSGAPRAAATITEADVRRRVFIIADDSMGGRDTPSRGLETTAQYIAREFARNKLVPAGDGGLLPAVCDPASNPRCCRAEVHHCRYRDPARRVRLQRQREAGVGLTG